MMDKRLQILLTCTFLAGLCVLTSSSNTFRVYHPVHKEKTWFEAQNYCREHHTDLVSIGSMKEYNEICAGMKGQHVYWTGLYKEKDDTQANKWYWSLAEPGSYRPILTGYGNWAQGIAIANAVAHDKRCGQAGSGVDSGGTWHRANCQDKKFFVCYDDRDGGPGSYILVKNALTWKEALDYCRTKHTDLAIIRNRIENQAMRSAVGIPFRGGFWIGLFWDRWRWSDRSWSSFRLWRPEIDVENSPGYYAAIHSNDGKLTKEVAGDKHFFICYSEFPDVPKLSTETPIIPTSATDSFVSTAPPFVSTVSPSDPKRKRQVLKLTVTTGSTVDLNDPTVTEAILKQVKDKLKQGGVSGDLKLTWKKQPDGKTFRKKTEL